MSATVIKTRRLKLHDDTSHKFYTVKLLESKTGYRIQKEHGRIGGHPRANAARVGGFRIISITPLIKSEDQALSKFNKIIEKKHGRGYV